jgi:hypothetical protein
MIVGHKNYFLGRMFERGYTLPEVEPCIASKNGDEWTIDETHPAYPREPKERTPGGPGTETKRLLQKWLGFTASPGCSCNGMALQMDVLGPDWSESEEGLAEILDVMRKEHAKRYEKGETKLPWSDFGARQLVKLACRIARRKAKAA